MDPAVLDELPLSIGKRLTLQAALPLYSPRNPSPAGSNLAATFDNRHYQTVLAALAEYRAGQPARIAWRARGSEADWWHRAMVGMHVHSLERRSCFC